MSSRTPLAEARGLGPAHEGAHHWGLERTYSAAVFALLIWLAVSLWRLPGLDQAMVTQWLRSPLAAVPMLLLIVTLFQHIRMGLAQVVEDYVHEQGSKLIWLALIHGAAILIGALALFSLLQIALGGGGGGGMGRG